MKEQVQRPNTTQEQPQQDADNSSLEQDLEFYDASSIESPSPRSTIHHIAHLNKNSQRKRGRGGNRQGIERLGSGAGTFGGRALSLAQSQAAREARIEWKFGQIVRNMKLEQISESEKEDMVSTSSSQFEEFQSDFGSPIFQKEEMSLYESQAIEYGEMPRQMRSRVFATPISDIF